MKAHITILCILATAATGLAGELSPVACEPGSALSSRQLYIRTSGFKPGEAGSGLVSSQARVGTISGKGWVFKLAIDASSTSAKAPDTIRLDFSGKGQFAGAASTPLKTTRTARNLYQGEFGPVEVQATIGLATVPVSVKGQYVKSGPNRYMMLTFGTAMQGKCSFDGKELPVRIIDGNNDLQPGDPWQRRTFGRSIAVVPGDTVAVDTGDGTFTKDVRRACYGSPVKVGGKWYDVTVSDDGEQIAAKPVTITAGKLHINHPKWSCLLIGEEFVMPLEGGTEPVPVPAGNYVLRTYEEFSAPDDKGNRAQLAVGLRPTAMTSKVKIESGKTNELAIGSPLQGTVKVVKRGTQYMLGLVLTDAAGRPIASLQTYGGKRPPKPRVTVKNAAGAKVYETSLEYG